MRTNKIMTPLETALSPDPLAAGYTIPGVGRQTVYGDDGKNTISTGSGDDMIAGELGSDTINAGTGDDVISSYNLEELAGDHIDGSLGFDELEIDLSTSATGVTLTALDPVVARSMFGANVVNVESYRLQSSNQ